jgi:peptidoglycan hydrolase-like protein with peptidoglycan-binding domain
MPLQSKLFAGDQRCEAALTSDQAHILQGDSGEHVRKIQIALNRIDGAGLAEDGRFGPLTSAAVLAFKKKRDLVNRAYQTTADAIVGKMTMAALDREFAALETSRRIVAETHYCRFDKGRRGTHPV